MTWIIRRGDASTFTAEHRASGVQIDLGHNRECVCRSCVLPRNRKAVEQWLRSLPDPPAELTEHL